MYGPPRHPTQPGDPMSSAPTGLRGALLESADTLLLECPGEVRAERNAALLRELAERLEAAEKGFQGRGWGQLTHWLSENLR